MLEAAPNDEMEFRPSGLLLNLGMRMKRSAPAQRIGLAEWKVEIEDGVQDFYREAFFPE